MRLSFWRRAKTLSSRQSEILRNRSDHYEPTLNRTYFEMASYYGCAVLPTRPCKPRDKAKVEAAVLLAERWILAVLRKQIFFSLDELNAAIRELVIRLNQKPVSKAEGFT